MSTVSNDWNTIVNVRNIGEYLTNEELEEMFNRYGTITSYKIINSSNIELGRFAYVAFQDPDAAEEAIIELNGQLISQDQRIKLCRTHAKLINHSCMKKKAAKEAIVREMRLCKENFVNYAEIYVKNLVLTIDADYLRRMFNHCGEVRTSKVIMENGLSKGYGFLTFATTDEANIAVKEMNGRNEQGKILHVTRSVQNSSTDNVVGATVDSPTSNNCEIYVKHLAPVIHSAYLRLLFQHCGDISSVKVIMNDGISKGYGFVTFTTPEAAKKAVTEMNHRPIEGNNLNVALACGINRSINSRGAQAAARPMDTTLANRSDVFVKNLAPHITAEYLKLLFNTRNRVMSAKVIMENGRSKGYGFVSLRTPEDATRAVEEMNGQRIDGQNLHVAISRGTDVFRGLGMDFLEGLTIHTRRHIRNNFRRALPVHSRNLSDLDDEYLFPGRRSYDCDSDSD